MYVLIYEYDWPIEAMLYGITELYLYMLVDIVKFTYSQTYKVKPKT